MRRICEIIHETGKRMLAEKKAAFEGKSSSGLVDADGRHPRMKGDLGEHMKGRDIMSIMRMCPTCSVFFSRIMF